MEHLEFVDRLNEFGISFRGNIENEKKVITIYSLFNKPIATIEIENLQCKYLSNNLFKDTTALDTLIKSAIDIDHWKHSIHLDINSVNYEEFIRIIQDKILNRVEDINFSFHCVFSFKKRNS